MTTFEKSKDYFYENTDILVNKLDIRDKKLLHDVERKLTSLRLSELMSNPILGEFDFDHLKKINYYLFQDLYPWAGEIRRSELAKLDLFCLYDNIEYFANIIFSKLKEENYYINYPTEEKIVKIAELFGDINGLHPFREGNGRTQREFIENFAKINGFELDLTRIGQDEMIKASHESMNGNNDLLLKLINENISTLSQDLQVYNIFKYCDKKLANKLYRSLSKSNKIRR